MKNKKFMVGILIVMFVFGVMFTGCPEDTEEVYEVWFSGPWAPSTTTTDPFYGQAIGAYKLVPQTEAQFNTEKEKNFKAPSQQMTKTEIKEYLVEKGFSEAKGTEISDKFVSEDYEHVLLGFTSPSTEYPTEGDLWNILR